MQLVWRGCALLMVLAACGDDGNAGKVDAATDAAVADPNEGLKSGTRMRLQWHEYGATRVYAGLFDTMRGESCNATVWSDGKTYCAPASAPIVYTDSACTTPMGLVSHTAGCTPPAPAYLLDAPPAACSSVPTHLYKAGAKIAAAQFYQLDTFTGACLGPNTKANADYYAVGAEVAVSDLALFTRETAADTGRLKRQFLTTSDGAKIFDKPHDTVLDLDCTPGIEYTGQTTGTCVPTAGAPLATLFHDSACTQGELAAQMQCAKPAYAGQLVSPACPGSPRRYFTVGDMVASSPLYLQSTSGCPSTTATTGQNYYTLGAPLVVAALTRTYDTLADRVVQFTHYSDSVTQLRDSVLYDTGHATECTELALADGSSRCVPPGGDGSIQHLFSDAGCTVAVSVVQVNTGPDTCGAARVPKFVLRNIAAPPGTCGFTPEIYNVGAAHTAPLYENGTTCNLINDPTARYYELGAQVPLTEFPLATPTKD